MTLPDFVLGTAMHYFIHGDCEAAVLVHRESDTMAALDLSRWDGVSEMNTERTSSAVSVSAIPYDPSVTPAEQTFHIASACPFNR